MSSQYVIISAYPADSNTHDDVVLGLGESGPSRKLYSAIDGTDVVEIRALDDLGQIKDMEPQWAAQKQAVRAHFTGDIRRQILPQAPPQNTLISVPRRPTTIEFLHSLSPAIIVDDKMSARVYLQLSFRIHRLF